MAAKKTAKKPTKSSTPKPAGRGSRGPRSGSKTAFILSHPLDSAAKAVVEAGKAAGHVFNDTYVWAVRAAAKRRAAAPASTSAASATSRSGSSRGVAARAERALAKLSARGTARAPLPSRDDDGGDPGPLAAGGSLESQFAALAVELGISRAEAILRRVREVLGKLTF